MTASPVPPVPAPCGTAQLGRFGVDGDELKIGARGKEIEFPARACASSAFNYQAGFEHSHGANQASLRGKDGGAAMLPFRLVEEDRC